MATFTRSITITSINANSPTAITQNVTVGDTINLTVNVSNNYSISSITENNCVADPTTTQLSGTVNQIDTFSGSSYSVQFVASDGAKNPTLYYGRISGTVTAGLTAPAIDYASHFNQQNSTTVTVQVNLNSNGTGGTLKYAAGTSASTPPSSGWQTSSTFTQNRGTTKYYWASQDENASGSFSSSSKAEVAADPILTSMPSTAAAPYGMLVFNDQNRLAFSTRRRTMVLQYTNTYTLAAGANTTISNIDGASDKDKVAVLIEGISNYSHTGTGNAVKISSRTSNSITITNSGSQSKSFRVKVLRVT